MSSDEDFISQVCNAFLTVNMKISGVALEGWEREYRRQLAQHLFDEVLGWEGYSRVAEIYDIRCLDDEGFSLIVVETKGPGIDLTHEIKEKLRRRIEELGTVKYGVFTNPSKFIIYEYVPYELKEVANVNIASATGFAQGLFGLSEAEKRQILKLEILKRERLVWIEDPDYFEKTYKEISVAKGEGVKLLTENLKGIVRDLTTVSMNFFDSYRRRKDHYSGRFLENTFNDWLKLSMKDEDFKKGNETERRKIIEVFCRETAYVLVGRILFIRMCEDKDILEPSLSGKRVAEFLRFYRRRKENVYLRALYDSREEIRKYYSHLHELGFFDWWWISPDKIGLLTHDDKRIQDSLEEDLNYSIKKCLRRLNRFDFTQVNRDILGDVYQGYLPPAERKRLGEFYTPKEVIEYILDAVGYKSANNITGKKILDPACGSGGFLVETIQRLIERYRKLRFNLKDPDDARQVIQECVNHIYGLDIHPFACFIAEMNLLFQLVDLYDVVKLKDRYYELPRLNIYRADSLIPLGATIIELIEFMDNSRRKMLIEETKGAEKVKRIKFDFVVGNPPYVRKERIDPEYKETVLEKAFPGVYHGDSDIFVYFISKGIEYLRDEGKLGFITSNRFMKARYGRGLRKYILDNCSCNQIIDFGVLAKVFKGSSPSPCIIILYKDSDPDKRKTNKIKVAVAREPREILENLLFIVKSHIGERYLDKSIDIFLLNQFNLGIREWKLISTQARDISFKIKENSQYVLEGVCTIDRGLYTGLNKAFVVDEKTVQDHNLEKPLIKQCLKGEDVRKYKINYRDLYVIYTYNININDYPNISNYLLQYKAELEKRWCVTDPRMGRKWYELEKPRIPYLFEASQIITPDLSLENNFTLNDEKYYCLNTCYIITPKKEYEEYLKYILGLLNSKVLEFYFKQISPRMSGSGRYRYIKHYLKQLPIKFTEKPREKRIAEEITRNVDRILQLSEQIRLLKRKIESFPDSYLEGDWSFNKLMNVVKTQNLSKPSYIISEKSLRTDYLGRDLNGKEIFRIILVRGEYIDFYSKDNASYVFEVLKTLNRITKRELLGLEIPSQEYSKNLMNQYQKDKKQIVQNEKAVEELEKQIDDLVYKLYDITYKERRIIEDYLAKF